MEIQPKCIIEKATINRLSYDTTSIVPDFEYNIVRVSYELRGKGCVISRCRDLPLSLDMFDEKMKIKPTSIVDLIAKKENLNIICDPRQDDDDVCCLMVDVESTEITIRNETIRYISFKKYSNKPSVRVVGFDTNERLVIGYNETVDFSLDPIDFRIFFNWDNTMKQTNPLTIYIYKRICDHFDFQCIDYGDDEYLKAYDLKMDNDTLKWTPPLTAKTQNIILNDQEKYEDLSGTTNQANIKNILYRNRNRKISLRIQTTDRYGVTTISDTIEVFHRVDKICISLLDDALPADIICHVCSTHNPSVAQGLAAELFQKYPNADLYKRCPVRNPGTVFIDAVEKKKEQRFAYLVHIILGNDKSSRMDDLRTCLENLERNPILKDKTIAFPDGFGCGGSAEKWPFYLAEIEKFAEKVKSVHNCEVFIASRHA